MNSYHFARLEERILLDGSVAAVAAPTPDAGPDASHMVGERVLIIPADTPQLDALVNNTRDNVKVVVFDSHTTSLSGLQQQILDTLNGQKAISIAFLNRANAANFALSSTMVISESTLLNQTEMQQFWSNIGSDLDGQGQIDILASGNLSPNLLFGLQTLTNAHVSESADLSGDALVGTNTNHYFNDNIMSHQDQLLMLFQSTAIDVSSSTTSFPPSNTSIPTDLIHFSINLRPEALPALIPDFAVSSAWNYTMTPNQDGSLNILLSLSNSSTASHLTLNDIAPAANFLMGGDSTSSDGTTPAGAGTSDGVISGPIIHINLSITREAFTVIQNILSTQSDISFRVDEHGNATVILNNPSDFTNMGPAAFIAKEIAILNASLSLNHESLQFTLFNTATDLNNGISSSSHNGVNFYSADSFFDYLGQMYTLNHTQQIQPNAHPDATISYSNSFDHNIVDQNNNSDRHTATTQTEPQDHVSEATRPIFNEATAAASMAIASILQSLESSTPLTTHLTEGSAKSFALNAENSSSSIISEQHLPNQKFGDQPFYPDNQKALNLISIHSEDTALKSVIGALSWAEFKMDGQHNEVPKESSLIQDFPNKTVPQGTDATLFSNKSTTSLRLGKGSLGLKD
jgi:hypothetical protein